MPSRGSWNGNCLESDIFLKSTLSFHRNVRCLVLLDLYNVLGLGFEDLVVDINYDRQWNSNRNT